MLGLNAEQLKSILKGAALAGIGAAAAVLAQAASSGALGPWSPVVGALVSVLANVVRKALEK